jgi:hypothetical protein
VVTALNRYNHINGSALVMHDQISPLTFAKIAHLLNHDAFHGLPGALQGSTTRLLRTTSGTICSLPDRDAPTTSLALARPSGYLGRQNITVFIDAADRMVIDLDHLDDEDMDDLASRFCRVLWNALVEMNACELSRLAGIPPDTTALDKLGSILASMYEALVSLDIEINAQQARQAQQQFMQQLEGYRKQEEEQRWKKEAESDDSEDESEGAPGCIGMSSNCPVRGLPEKLYRWQSFNPKNGINLPSDDKGIPTAINGKVAYNMGAIAVDFLVEIDRDLLIAAIGDEQVRKGFYSVSGSRGAGWEFKLWVAVPVQAITKVWGKGIVPAKHKPKGL